VDLRLVVLDYDGTIAESGVLGAAVRAAIAELRARGIAVVIATGRMLRDLQQAVGDLRFVDAIVAENGAVVAFPDSGRSAIVGSPSSGVVEHLAARGIEFQVGECLIDTDARNAQTVLEVIRETRQPLVLAFNRERLMVLPQGISKETGLRTALRALRLSEHNALAVGDAENDHTLLAACEVGLAVEWGSPALRAVADGVLPGTGTSAVAEYLRGLTLRAPGLATSARHQVLLGTEEATGRTLQLSIQGRNVLIAGDPRSGKSWLAGLLCEQLILQRYSVCVVDPEGDYRTLESLPGVIAFGGSGPLPRPYDVARTLRDPNISMVIDLSQLHHDEKRDYVWTLLPLIAGLRRQNGLPHRILVDEAHYFAVGSDGGLLIDSTAGGYTLVTYRPIDLPQPLRQGCVVKLAARTTESVQLGVLQAGASPAQMGRLSLGEAVLCSGVAEAPNTSVRFRIAPRLTEHVRHRQKYLDVPVAERLAFVFTDRGRPCGQRSRTLMELCTQLATCSEGVIAGHLRRGDVSQWVGDVFGDQVLAGEIRVLEQLHQLGQSLDAVDALSKLVHDRYALLDAG
jgi:hydroxymethylpyrimidine pyrophosphatase-like HAD family hydrolase